MSLVDIEQKALHLLSLREHTRQELHHKLIARQFDSNAVQTVLDKLAEQGFLSDRRFAQSYIRVRSQKGFGPRYIRNALRERGVNNETIESIFLETEIDWHAIAYETKVKKYGQKVQKILAKIAIQQRFLEYRGFENEQIRYAVELDDENR